MTQPPPSRAGKAAYERMARRRYLPLSRREDLWDRLEGLFPGDPEYDVVLEWLTREWGAGAKPLPLRDPPEGWGAHCHTCGLIFDQPLAGDRLRKRWLQQKPLCCAGCRDRLDTSLHK